MNANVAITSLAGSDTDYTMIFGSVVRAAIRGLPVKVVASFIDEFKSPKELKGKTLGVQAYGATDHVSAVMMFTHLGVDAEKGHQGSGVGLRGGAVIRAEGRCCRGCSHVAAGGRRRQEDGFQHVGPCVRAF